MGDPDELMFDGTWTTNTEIVLEEDEVDEEDETVWERMYYHHIFLAPYNRDRLRVKNKEQRMHPDGTTNRLELARVRKAVAAHATKNPELVKENQRKADAKRNNDPARRAYKAQKMREYRQLQKEAPNE